MVIRSDHVKPVDYEMLRRMVFGIAEAKDESIWLELKLT